MNHEEIKITIDGINLHHRLENESTVQEIVVQIHEWLRSNQRVASSIAVNGTQYDADRMGCIEIDQVNTLDFTTVHPHELSIRRLNLLKDILDILYDAHNSKNAKVLENFGKSASDIHELFHSAFPEEPPRDFFTSYNKKHFSYIIALVDERKAEFIDPIHTGIRTAQLLLKHLEHLSELPVMLQTGKEQAAMKLLIVFSESTRKLIRIYLILKTRCADLDTENFTHLNNSLSELEQALNSGDTVLVGDLVEYEIVPQFKENINHILAKLSTAETQTTAR